MDSDQGKLFIGGISWETDEGKLSDYFGNYGDVLQTVVMRDKITGRPRGFGFVVFADLSVLDRVLQEKHTIDGRTVRFGLDSVVIMFLFIYQNFDLDVLYPYGFCSEISLMCYIHEVGLD